MSQGSTNRTLAGATGLLTLAILALFPWFAGKTPEGRIVLAVGGADGGYADLAKTYAGELKRYGVSLELKPDIQGAELIKALQDPKSGLDGGIIKGGFMGSLTGRLASAKARDRHEEQRVAVRSVGRLLLEPIWVFTRGDLPIASLRDLEGKKILTGTVASGSRRVALQLLRANGVNTENSVLMDKELTDDAKALSSGEADAAILILPPETDRIQRLLRVENIRLMDFSPEAQAYTSRFPALTSVVMNRAAVEFEPVIPSANITLLATSAALVVRANLDSSLVNLLTNSVVQNPKAPVDRSGDPVLFHVAGQFPSGADPEYEVPSQARQLYKSGELPFLIRTLGPLNQRLGLPFSMTSLASNYGVQALLVLIPALTLLLPLMRLLPMLYQWSIRRRLLYWYGQLKALERRMDHSPPDTPALTFSEEIEFIDSAARRIRVPLQFSDQLYDLRAHIDLVRRRIALWPMPLPSLAGTVVPPLSDTQLADGSVPAH